MSHIPYAKHTLTAQDIQFVVSALESDRLTQGSLATQFEQEVAKYCGANYAVAVSNGSMALIAACMAAGVGSGDIVWTTPNTFIATANCALHCNAAIDFVDIDPVSYNINTGLLETKLKTAKSAGKLPKVVIPVHFAGNPCDMAAIGALAREYGFMVIEDAAHALGSEYQQRKIGNSGYCDMTIFSFHPSKSITCGEGGMVLTDDYEIYQRLRDISLQGMVRDPERFEQPADGNWYYEQQTLGFNLRISELQAALGLSQLQRLPAIIQQRQQLAAYYQENLQDLPITLPDWPAEGDSAWHLYVVRLHMDRIPISKAELTAVLAEQGIGTQVHYIPVHSQPVYRRLGFSWGDFPQAEQYYREALSLPLYPDLEKEQQDRVIASLRDILGTS